jgi:hypothetical protein
MHLFSEERIDKHAYNDRVVVQNGTKESSVENRHSSFTVPSEQLVESWALQGRLRT